MQNLKKNHIPLKLATKQGKITQIPVHTNTDIYTHTRAEEQQADNYW